MIIYIQYDLYDYCFGEQWILLRAKMVNNIILLTLFSKVFFVVFTMACQLQNTTEKKTETSNCQKCLLRHLVQN